MRYQSKFVVGLQGSEALFICQTLNRELLVLPVVPRAHIVIVVGDIASDALAVLVGNT